MAIKILIADDHPLIADGIKNTFMNQSDFEVISIANNGKEVLDIVKSKAVDIALLDINMPEMDGIQCAKILIKDYPEIKVAILSMHQEASIIKELIGIGIKGYMLKTIPADELLMAVKRIYKGQDYFTADVTKAILKNDNSVSTFVPLSQKSSLVAQLTQREIEIIQYLTQGLTNVQIGEKLFISPRTVDTHRTNIMKKINVHNVASLIRFAFQNGLT
jgi:two-component system response regulator NreC